MTHPKQTLPIPATSSSLKLPPRLCVSVGPHGYIGFRIKMVPNQVMSIFQEVLLHWEGAAPCCQGWGAPKVVGKQVGIQCG
jgi:hypothetical protein